MIQLFSIDVRSSDGKKSLFYQSFDNCHVGNEDLIEAMRKDFKDKYSTMVGQKVKIDMHYKTRPDKNVTPLQIAITTCELMEYDHNKVLGGNKYHPYVKVKMFINQICLDAGYAGVEIEEYLWKNRLYNYYRRKTDDMFYAQPHEKKRFDEIKDKVLTKLFK